MKQNNETLAEAMDAKMTVLADSIRRVSLKMVTITRPHKDKRYPYTIIDLAIEPELYEKLLQVQAANSSKYATWFPFVFLINKKNKAFDLMPLEVFAAQQEANSVKAIEVCEVGELQ